ncbi:MAG: formylglycine-generating enzyme family protein [Gemmatimonadetes bacterium]|nr:formylglycine-generating enzyme family protein [Gemmatimonadota bacterium]
MSRRRTLLPLLVVVTAPVALCSGPGAEPAVGSGAAVRTAAAAPAAVARATTVAPTPAPAARPEAGVAPASRREMARVPAGSYLPLYAAGRRRVPVAAFEMDRYPVTRAEYLEFVRRHPEWRRSRVAVAGYLADWRGDLDFGDATDARRPVTRVPRAAAQAFCAAEGKRLPTTDEWEYAAGAGVDRRDAASDPAFRQRLLELYTRPRGAEPAPIGSTFRNAFGLSDLHGLVWEWVQDAMPADHAHHAGGAHDMGCAGSANGATDPDDYPAFLRYAFRAALTPDATLPNLGFRCAR